ncbi:helix-turn-helix domain-containing protein [Anaerocolumna sp. MB42-C2]|uniref:helix-turn-helix domain-containing protein n=1 Tax=Anaerocolumna sp. MB42-C2 TaxID=3070997 RepID=UPI0027DFA3A9|nr:helix-turn-helix transcriptional regulator [Anaerocolumna sp. MB42-C2]WMJ87758.1 helix-turn-helix transcriptional regulator [Anaerocolumna sp. MB42-C2]
MKNILLPDECYNSFGEYVKARREALGKSIRGLASELDMTPAYLSDIEKGNRNAPERYLEKMTEVLCIEGDDAYYFYDLAGKSRNNIYPDLVEYIGNTEIARVALRKARDLNISNSQWQDFIDQICGKKKMKEEGCH